MSARFNIGDLQCDHFTGAQRCESRAAEQFRLLWIPNSCGNATISTHHVSSVKSFCRECAGKAIENFLQTHRARGAKVRKISPRAPASPNPPPDKPRRNVEYLLETTPGEIQARIQAAGANHADCKYPEFASKMGYSGDDLVRPGSPRARAEWKIKKNGGLTPYQKFAAEQNFSGRDLWHFYSSDAQAAWFKERARPMAEKTRATFNAAKWTEFTAAEYAAFCAQPCTPPISGRSCFLHGGDENYEGDSRWDTWGEVWADMLNWSGDAKLYWNADGEIVFCMHDDYPEILPEDDCSHPCDFFGAACSDVFNCEEMACATAEDFRIKEETEDDRRRTAGEAEKAWEALDDQKIRGAADGAYPLPRFLKERRES